MWTEIHVPSPNAKLNLTYMYVSRLEVGNLANFEHI